jgi:nucleoid DNA-binding protein
MSEVGSAVPFIAITTPTIERANRLMHVQTLPGFLDIIRISQELVKDADDACADYGGWDPQQIVVLKVRMQAAREHHALLLKKIKDAIEAGILEQKAAMESAKPTPEEIRSAIEQGDLVRQAVLTKFDQKDAEQRTAGSYDTEDPDERL